jgi:RimJ/RimL family protein N-acetyltransferase
VVDYAPISDGVVAVRPPRPGDAAILIAGRDEDFHRWLGPGTDTPSPVGCIVVDSTVVGWVDYDTDRDWLGPGEVNLGYNVLAPYRGNGYAARAVELLIDHLAVATTHRTAVLLIHPDNLPSLSVAARLRFRPSGSIDGSLCFKRAVRTR